MVFKQVEKNKKEKIINKLCPRLDFEENGRTEGTVEYLLSSLKNQRNVFVHDRSKLNDHDVEETKVKLEKDLTLLIEQTAKRNQICSDVAKNIIQCLKQDLLNIVKDVNLPNINKQQFFNDAKESLKQKYYQKLESDFKGVLKTFVSPRFTLEDDIVKIKEFLSQREESNQKTIELNEFFNQISRRGFLVRGEAGMGKTTLTK